MPDNNGVDAKKADDDKTEAQDAQAKKRKAEDDAFNRACFAFEYKEKQKIKGSKGFGQMDELDAAEVDLNDPIALVQDESLPKMHKNGMFFDNKNNSLQFEFKDGVLTSLESSSKVSLEEKASAAIDLMVEQTGSRTMEIDLKGKITEDKIKRLLDVGASKEPPIVLKLGKNIKEFLKSNRIDERWNWREFISDKDRIKRYKTIETKRQKIEERGVADMQQPLTRESDLKRQLFGNLHYAKEFNATPKLFAPTDTDDVKQQKVEAYKEQLFKKDGKELSSKNKLAVIENGIEELDNRLTKVESAADRMGRDFQNYQDQLEDATISNDDKKLINDAVNDPKAVPSRNAMLSAMDAECQNIQKLIVIFERELKKINDEDKKAELLEKLQSLKERFGVNKNKLDQDIDNMNEADLNSPFVQLDSLVKGVETKLSGAAPLPKPGPDLT